MLRQHSNRLNTEELLRFLYQTCQELGLMKELLKLPLGLAEQVGCLVTATFLSTRAKHDPGMLINKMFFHVVTIPSLKMYLFVCV